MYSINSFNNIRLVFMAVIMTVLMVNGARADAVIVKVASAVPDGHKAIETLRKALAEISQRSDGEVLFKLYPGGVAGDETDVIRKMRTNRIHMSPFTGVGVGHIAAHTRVAESPRVFRNNAEIDYVRSKLYREFEQYFRRKGYVLLGWSEGGFIYIYSKHNVLEHGNFRKLKMWTWKGDPEVATYFNDLGFNTVPLHISDVTTGLETGLIDTCFGPPVAATAFQWYSRLKYMLDFPIANVMLVMLMTEKKFVQLSPKTQKLLKDVMFDELNGGTKMVRRLNRESITVMKKAGMEILKPTPKQVAYYEQQANVTITNAIQNGLFSKELFGRVQRLLQDYRKKKKS